MGSEMCIRDSTIPGLEPDRVFVREGIASVPLPNVSEAQSVQPVEASLSTPEPANIGAGLPDLPDLADLLPEDNQSVVTPPVQETSQEPTPTDIVLPDLDDLFIQQQESTLPSSSTLPDLPDLDDLF